MRESQLVHSERNFIFMNQQLTVLMDEVADLRVQLVQVTRLALAEREDDLRLYVARIVRKLRAAHPATAIELEELLKQRPPSRPVTPFRRGPTTASMAQPNVVRPPTPLPIDEESKLALFKVFQPDESLVPPLLSPRVRHPLEQLVVERKHSADLAKRGLLPSRSAAFVGRPGVGKTLTARWLAQQLNAPLLVLDLTAVMSSLLGRSGANLRAALDYAKSFPCVLLLDEIDAIAKRRNDDADVGELKRLVTVILQEVDAWPSTGLMLAATNHPELIDPALWRRFDLVVEFDPPTADEVERAISRFLGPDGPRFKKWLATLALMYRGESYSDIERGMNRLRRSLVLGSMSEKELIEAAAHDRIASAKHADRIELATELVATNVLSQHAASALTGVSRDTIRKRTAAKS